MKKEPGYFFLLGGLRKNNPVLFLLLCAVLLMATDAQAGAAETTPETAASTETARAEWEAQGDWLVNTAHRCQVRKPETEGWMLARDATAGWVIVHRAPEATIEVLCDVRDAPAAPRQMARAALDHAYGRTGEPQSFLPQARFRQRQVTFQGAGAIRLWIEGPYSTGVWRADTYLIFRRKHLLVVLHATATPKGAHEAHQEAIEGMFNSLTWF